jgi:hypothetical protein
LRLRRLVIVPTDRYTGRPRIGFITLQETRAVAHAGSPLTLPTTALPAARSRALLLGGLLLLISP